MSVIETVTLSIRTDRISICRIKRHKANSQKQTCILCMVTLENVHHNTRLFLLPEFTFTGHDFPLSSGGTDDGNVAVSGKGAVSGKTNMGIVQKSFPVRLGQNFQLFL